MPVEIFVLLFALILACLGFIVRAEYRRLIRSRESRMFERLYNSRL